MLMVLTVAPTMAQGTVQSQPSVVLDISDVIVIAVVTAIVFGGAVLGARKGKPLDAELVYRLENLQSQREHMERYERLFASATQAQKGMIDTFANVLRGLAPVTPFGFDDALLRFYDDAKKAGAPSATLDVKRADEALYPPSQNS